MGNAVNYGAALKAELRRKGKTQRWLADKLGVTTPAVSHWVQGVAKIPAGRKLEIQEALDWRPFGEVNLKDLEGKWERVRTPLAFILAQEVPGDLVPASTPMPGVVGSQEYRRRALDLWGRWLGVEAAELVKIAEGGAYLQEWQVRRFFDAGVVLTYLGEHLGHEVTEQVALDRWVAERQGRYDTFSDYLEAVRVAAAAPALLEACDPLEGRERARGLLDGRDAQADDVYEYWMEVTR